MIGNSPDNGQEPKRYLVLSLARLFSIAFPGGYRFENQCL
jgi:hypothetical protein